MYGMKRYNSTPVSIIVYQNVARYVMILIIVKKFSTLVSFKSGLVADLLRQFAKESVFSRPSLYVSHDIDVPLYGHKLFLLTNSSKPSVQP